MLVEWQATYTPLSRRGQQLGFSLVRYKNSGT